MNILALPNGVFKQCQKFPESAHQREVFWLQRKQRLRSQVLCRILRLQRCLKCELRGLSRKELSVDQAIKLQLQLPSKWLRSRKQDLEQYPANQQLQQKVNSPTNNQESNLAKTVLRPIMCTRQIPAEQFIKQASCLACPTSSKYKGRGLEMIDHSGLGTADVKWVLKLGIVLFIRGVGIMGNIIEDCSGKHMEFAY